MQNPFALFFGGRAWPRAALPLLLPLLLAGMLCLAMQTAAHANSGGVTGQPTLNDYTGTDSSGNVTPTGGRVTIDSDVTGNVRGGYADTLGTAATNNTVTMTGGTVGADVYGGQAIGGDVTGNSVTISGGTVTNYVYGGWSTDHAASNNSVTISGGTVGFVYGGRSSSVGFSAIGNTVIISGGMVTNGVIGGSNSTGNATGNTVRIMGTASFGANAIISGGSTGASGGDEFTGNTLHMDVALAKPIAQVLRFETINFGYAGNANITTLTTTAGRNTIINTNANAVDFSGTITGTGGIIKTGAGVLALSGANTYSGDTTINEGKLSIAADSNIGGGVNTIGNAGTLALSGNGATYTKDWTLSGANSAIESVNVNTYSGVLSGTGGLTKTGAGTLTLSGANTYSGGTTISAGKLSIAADSNIGGGANSIGNAGILALSGNGATYAKNWTLDGAGSAIESANDNTLSGTLSGTGGLTKTGAGTLILSNTNTYSGGTTISEGKLSIAADNNIGGGANSIGNAGTLALSGNGATYTKNWTLDGANSAIESANDNTLSGTLSGTGGLTKTGAGALTLTGANTYSGGTTISEGSISTSGTGTLGTGALNVANGATLTLGGAAQTMASLSGAGNITSNVALTVGDASNTSYSGVLSGTGSLTKTGAGTLTLSGTNSYTGMTTVQSGTLALGGGSLASKDLTLYGGAAFDRGAFTHPLNTGSLTVDGGNGQSATYAGNLSASGAALNFIAPVKASGPLLNVSGTADISNSVVNLGVAGGAAHGTATYTLLQSTGALTAPGITKGSGIVGIERVYTYELEATGNALLAHMENTQSDAAVRKSPAEAKSASVALMTQGADLAAGAGMGNAKAAAGGNKGGAVGNLGVAGFGAVSGGTSRYNTGSHVDVNSLSLMTGFAKTWQAPGVDILGGVFFEGGWGSYNSYNGLEGGGDFNGKGNSRYYGGGLLGRVDVTESVLRGAYAEASLRVGGLHTDYRSDILPGSNNNERGSYDASATYYGAHLGLGYVWELNEKASLDLYGKYFWNHTTGMDVTILDSRVNMDAVNSHRTRFGARFGYAVNEYFTPYVGAAWEYEFDGKAKSMVMGESAPAPSLKGSTGVGELGLTWKPKADSPLSVDFGVTGYVGMREGVSGNVQLKFEF